MARDSDVTRESAVDEPATETPHLRAVVERYENRPDQCTIYPENDDGIDRTTTWITAIGSAFVDVSRTR
jgi:hypothetical protein